MLRRCPPLWSCFYFSLGLFLNAVLAADREPHYPFGVEPLSIYDRLSDVGRPPAFAKDERKFLADCWTARSQRHRSPAKIDETALRAFWYASGISDPKLQADYTKKFDSLVSEAKKSLGKIDSPRERADRLLQFLHDGVMSKGYQLEETTLSAVFDRQQFNCVSSTAIYCLVGARLDLDLQVILIPGGFTAGHAAVDLRDGNDRIPIEPTNKDGFDSEAKKNRPGYISIGLQPDRSKAYDSDIYGLAASMASNQGVWQEKARKEEDIPSVGDDTVWYEAVRWNVRAVSFDPTDHGITQNMLSTLSNRGLAEAKSARCENAVQILQLCAHVAPKEGRIRENQKFAWSKYIDQEIDAGRDAQALKVVERAAVALPDDRDLMNRASWFVSAGSRQTTNWEDALKIADRAEAVLTSDAELKEIRGWRTTLFRLQSQKLLEAGDVDGSLAVLSRAGKSVVVSDELRQGLQLHVQEALSQLEATGGAKQVLAHFQSVVKEFPDHSAAVREVAVAHTHRATQKLVKEHAFADALAVADAYKPLVGNDRDEVIAWIFDGWARHLFDADQPNEALDKYVDGLKVLPENRILNGNGPAMVIRWSRGPMDQKDWKKAMAIYDAGLKRFPDDSALKQNKDYCLHQLKEEGGTDPSGEMPDADADKLVDVFQTDSVWENGKDKMTLTVTERNGAEFKATLKIGNSIERIVTGTVENGKVEWLAKHVRAVMGTAGDDNLGTMARDKQGHKIDFVWGPDKKSGRFTLRLKK